MEQRANASTFKIVQALLIGIIVLWGAYTVYVLLRFGSFEISSAVILPMALIFLYLIRKRAVS
jgi:hypothetical protein